MRAVFTVAERSSHSSKAAPDLQLARSEFVTSGKAS